MTKYQGVVIEPDSFRAEMHGQAFIPGCEDFVWASLKLAVRALFRSGNNTIIIDATNTTNEAREQWKRIGELCGAEVLFKIFGTSRELCHHRALDTGRPDLLPVIERMANQWEDFVEGDRLL